MLLFANTRLLKFLFLALLTASVVSLSGIITGCGGSGTQKEDTCLVKIGKHKLTVYDFNSALEIAKTAYPHNEIQDSDLLKSIRLNLLNQLVEEMMITIKASELGITISENELDSAVAAIKEDYPGEEFEHSFLENAISFESWKKRLKSRLLIEKVIETQLQNKISITPEDISNYYGANQKEDISETNGEKSSDDIDESVIKNIRRKKAEALYSGWIENLRQEYTVDINKKIWNKMVGS